MSGAALRRWGMGPQSTHSARAWTSSSPKGRLLDHFRFPYAKLEGLEILVLDEADRMLDMGFLPDIRRVLKHLPPRRQTLFFSATMPAPIMTLTRELLRNPATINLERKSAPAVGITQAVYPVTQDVKSSLLLELIKRGDMKSAWSSEHQHAQPTRRFSGVRASPASASTAKGAGAPTRRWRASKRPIPESSSHDIARRIEVEA